MAMWSGIKNWPGLAVAGAVMVSLALGVQTSALAEFSSELFHFHVFENAGGADPLDVVNNVYVRVSNATELVTDPSSLTSGSDLSSLPGTTNYDDNFALFEVFVLSDAPAGMAVTEVYVEDGVLVDADSLSLLVQDVTEVSYTVDSVSPPNLPGGENLSPPFKANQTLSADPANPPTAFGIGPGEILGMMYDLGSSTFDQVLAAIYDGFDPDKVKDYKLSLKNPNIIADPTIRLGIHVQGLGVDNELSVSAVMVPEPTSAVHLVWLLLGGGMLAGLCCFRRRS